MIYIERLKSKIKRPFLSLCDLFHKDNSLGNNRLRISFDTKGLLPRIKNKLRNVQVGSNYGHNGIDILTLTLMTNNPDLVIETHYADLLALSVKQQKWLLKNYAVILCDFEEGGDVYNVSAETEGSGPCLIEYIKSLGIVPKKIISLTPGIFQGDYSQLNIKSIHINLWPIITISNTPFYSNFVFDKDLKEKAIKQLDSPRSHFGLCLNKKPRLDRVRMLAELDNRNMLGKFDWSLMYSKESSSTNDDLGHFIKSPNNFKFNKSLEIAEESLINFLNKYSFPQLIQDIRNEQYSDAYNISPSWFGKYYYYLSTETFSDYVTNSLGYSSSVTEKTFKPMCIGAYPLVLGLPGFELYVRNLGFKLAEFDYDKLEGNQRILSIADTIQSLSNLPFEYNSMVIHNFDLITNADFLASLISNSVNSLVEHINETASDVTHSL